MLKPSGQLYIHDVILEHGNALENIQAFIRKQSIAGGDFLKNDAEAHFQQEHSTYDWILNVPPCTHGIQNPQQNYPTASSRNTMVLVIPNTFLEQLGLIQ
jgi:hypothetical protein